MIVRRVSGADRHNLEVGLKSLNGKTGKVGWFKGDTYPTGVSVAKVAAVQEYGFAPKNIPPRPFMRPTIVQYKATWKSIAYNKSLEVIKGKTTAYNVMEDIGNHAAGKIRKTISNLYTPSLQFSTIQARLSRRKIGKKGRPYTAKEIGNLYKPLVDTRHMYNTLTSEVE